MYFSGRDAPDQTNVISELVALSTDTVLNQVPRVDFGKLSYQQLMGEGSNTIEEEYRLMIYMIQLERRASWPSFQPIPKHLGFRSDKCHDLIPTMRSLLRWQTMHCLVSQSLLVMLTLSVYWVRLHLSRISFTTESFLRPCMRLHESGQRQSISRWPKECFNCLQRKTRISLMKNRTEKHETEPKHDLGKQNCDRNTISEGEERQEDDCGLLSLFEDL